MALTLSNLLSRFFTKQPKPNPTFRTSLRVESLHERITPAFTVNLYGGSFVFFQGSVGNDTLTLTANANGLLQHDISLGGNLVSSTDLDALEAGEQSLSLAGGYLRSASIADLEMIELMLQHFPQHFLLEQTSSLPAMTGMTL